MPQHPRSDSPVLRFRQCVQQTILARDAGFDAIASSHHYLSPPYQSLQNVPLLCRLAADAGDMQLILGIVLLPLLNPVQVAEEIATLDIMCEGRLIFGVGLGYREVEFEGFGVNPRDKVGRIVESLELIKRLWTEDNVTFEGRFFQLHNATCTIRPVQKPHPPIWIAANADSSVARAGRLGYPWFINPHAALPTIERQWRIYKDAAAKAGHPIPATRPSIQELHVAPTREEAIATARPSSKRSIPPMLNGVRTRCCRARNRFASDSRNWRATASSSAAPKTLSSNSNAASIASIATSSSSGSDGPGWRTTNSSK